MKQCKGISTPVLEEQRFISRGRAVIRSEIDALTQLANQLDHSFSAVVSAMLACRGNVVLSGVGKPYIIAQKIAASLASTGTPAIALHPVDALHGDLGRIRAGDVVLLFSRSGSTAETLDLARAVRALDVTRVAVTASDRTSLARECELALAIGEPREADHLGVVPSATSTAMLALGDALTLTVAEVRGLTSSSFARLHPAGALGKRLRRVVEIMRPVDRIATVRPGDSIIECLRRITEHRCGAALVCDESFVLLGIFTDGDLRRSLEIDANCLARPVRDLMTKSPRAISSEATVSEACDLLTAHAIDEVPVVDTRGVLVGQVDIQDVM